MFSRKFLFNIQNCIKELVESVQGSFPLFQSGVPRFSKVNTPPSDLWQVNEDAVTFLNALLVLASC